MVGWPKFYSNPEDGWTGLAPRVCTRASFGIEAGDPSPCE
jgi:hypothetical protein